MVAEPQPRSVPAEAMLARIAPLFPALGITRLGVLTGLDRLGIPVAAAYRPNSRSIAVHQGKGVSLAAAKISAAMEALECCHAETAAPPLRWAAADELPGPALAGCEGPERLLWAEARDLAAGGAVWVPFELVSADFSAPAPAGFGRFRQTTNGLASGPTPTEAIVQALCEVLERDAVARWHAAGPAAQAATGVALDTLTGAANRWLLGRCAAAGVAARLWDASEPEGPAVMVALLAEADGVAGIEPELGYGCHPDAEVAAARALLEAAQARLTRISGARDDFLPSSYAVAARAGRHAAGARLLALPARGAFRARRGRGDPEADLAALLDGRASVACVDLTRPDIGIPVARVVVPGTATP